VPNVKKAAIITDNSPSSHGFVTRIEKTALPVEISECYTTDDFDAWKAKVKELQPKVDAIGLFVYHTIKDPAKAGEVNLPPEDVLSGTLRYFLARIRYGTGILCDVWYKRICNSTCVIFLAGNKETQGEPNRRTSCLRFQYQCHLQQILPW